MTQLILRISIEELTPSRGNTLTQKKVENINALLQDLKERELLERFWMDVELTKQQKMIRNYILSFNWKEVV